MFAADGSEGLAKGLHAVAKKRDPGLAGCGERGRRALKGNAALVEKGNVIADRKSLRHIMRDDEGREAEAALVFGDHGEDGIPAERVETLSKGSLEAAKNADDATMAKDRRVDLVVVNPAAAAPKAF